MLAHHTVGDVTFTDCSLGGFAGPSRSIGTARAISQPQTPSESQGMSNNSRKFDLASSQQIWDSSN